MELRDICALLLREAATLPVRDFGTLCPGNSLALFLLHSLALPLLNIKAFLLGHLLALFLGHLFALLGPDVTTNLFVVNLFTDLSGYWVTFLSINCLAFLPISSLALTTRYILK